MANKTAFSKRGLPYGAAVDVDALSDRAAWRPITVPVVIATASGQTATAVFTQNTTVKHTLAPVGVPCILRAAAISQTTLAAGGTLSWAIYAYDASADAEIALTSGVDPEAGTVREAQTFTLAGTNVALAAEDTFELHCTADNNTVSQDARGVRVTLWVEPIESDPPTR
jgi:hypothetical protein